MDHHGPNICREGAKKTEPGCFQWCPVTRQGAMGTNWNMGGSLWTSGNPFLLWGSPSTGIGCPGRLWSLCPWRYSKTLWTWCWGIGSRQSFLSRGLGQMTSRGAFQPQPFYNSTVSKGSLDNLSCNFCLARSRKENPTLIVKTRELTLPSFSLLAREENTCRLCGREKTVETLQCRWR